MGRVLYLSVYNTNDSMIYSDGVMKKISFHISALRKYGHNVDYVHTDGKYIFYNLDEKDILIGKFCGSGYKYHNRLLRLSAKFLKNNCLRYDYIYIRHGALSYSGFSAFSTLKSHSKRIYLEIPTYYVPQRNIKNEIKFFFNRFLKKYVDVIVLDCLEEKVYGIPTLKIINGTDLSKIVPRKPINKETIDVLLVASIQDYHGVDKIFEAIERYYEDGGEEKIIFHIVGSGPKLDYYLEKRENFKYKDKILFYGKLQGNALFEVFDKCDIGISSLSNKELGVTYSSTLKSKEYLAKGLPIIADVMLDVFYENPMYFFYQLKQDFNIMELVYFYHSVYDDRDVDDVVNDIRNFANKNCDIFSVFKQVDDNYLSYIKGEIK